MPRRGLRFAQRGVGGKCAARAIILQGCVASSASGVARCGRSCWAGSWRRWFPNGAILEPKFTRVLPDCADNVLQQCPRRPHRLGAQGDVELATESANLVITRRACLASSRIVTAAEQMLEELHDRAPGKFARGKKRVRDSVF